MQVLEFNHLNKCKMGFFKHLLYSWRVAIVLAIHGIIPIIFTTYASNKILQNTKEKLSLELDINHLSSIKMSYLGHLFHAYSIVLFLIFHVIFPFLFSHYASNKILNYRINATSEFP